MGYDKLLFHERYNFVVMYLPLFIPLAARSKAWVCGRSIAGIAVSNPKMATTGNGTSDLRIVRKYPGIAWQRVWTNVHTTGLSDPIKSTWYAAIHEIIPTNERLAAIHLTTTTSCVRCGAAYTTASTNCLRGRTSDMDLDENQDSGNTTHTPKHIPEEWTLRPTFHHWPPQKQAAMIWIVAHLVAYRLQTQRRLSLADCMEFLQRACWKEYH